MTTSILAGAEPFTLPGDPELDIGCLLIHGFTATPLEMRSLAEHLAAQGCEVRAILLPGHATSPEDLQRTTWPQWVAAAREGLAALREVRSRVYLGGLSTGGAIALYLAAREQVAGVAALSVPYRIPGDRLRPLIFCLKYLLPYIKKRGSDWHDPQAEARRVTYPVYPTRAVVELMKFIAETKRGLAQVQTPTLLINSRDDSTAKPAHGKAYYERLGTTDKQLHFIEGSGHVITEDAQRDKVAQMVWSWITEHE